MLPDEKRERRRRKGEFAKACIHRRKGLNLPTTCHTYYAGDEDAMGAISIVRAAMKVTLVGRPRPVARRERNFYGRQTDGPTAHVAA